MTGTDSSDGRLLRPSERIPTGLETSRRFAGDWAAAMAGLPGDTHSVQVQCRRQGWGTLRYNRSIMNQPLKLGDAVFQTGLGTHADSELVVRANQPIRCFRAWAGMDGGLWCRNGNPGSPERLIFSVEADGRELWRSVPLGVDSRPVRVEAQADGATELVLKAWDVRGHTGFGHADWADAEVELADGTRVRLEGGAFATQSVQANVMPFSFRVGGGAGVERLAGACGTRTVKSPAGVTTHEVNRRDAAGGIECVLEIKTFADSPAVEWSVRLRNTGAADTPPLSDLMSLDVELAASGSAAPPAIHAVRGCANGAAPFALDRIEPAPGEAWRIGNPWGAKTGMHLPFANLDLGGHGLFCGLGWPGRWTLAVEHRPDGSIRLTGGLARASLVLHPGEEISLPTVLVIPWDGDRMAAHNRFRQHLLRYHSPSCNGEPAPSLLACATWGGMKTENHLRLIETLRRHQAPFNCYWIDAGWYGPAHETEEYQSLKTEDWYFHVGDWRPNLTVHPNGLKPVSDAAHAAGMRFLLWFEVERAVETCPWVVEHPDWFFRLRNEGTPTGRPCCSRTFNFGNPAARQAMTDRIAGLIRDLGIDVFRQDCNASLAEPWDAQDTPDRIGMSEIRYVEGLLAFWDELQRRFPHLLFDIVQRRDLTTIARSLDLSRSDHEFMPHTDVMASQGAQYGLSHWTPLSGTAVPSRPGNDYVSLSGLSSSFAGSLFQVTSDVPISVEPPANYPWEWLRRVLDTHRRAQPFFRGDFYPLLEEMQSSQHWAAMQFHRPDLDAGVVLVFRRKDAPYSAASLRLRALDAEGTYELADANSVQPWCAQGRDLTETGMHLELQTVPECRLVFYRKAKGPVDPVTS